MVIWPCALTEALSVAPFVETETGALVTTDGKVGVGVVNDCGELRMSTTVPSSVMAMTRS